MTLRNVALALLGAAVLVSKPWYHGPAEEVFYSYAGNFSVSFALYFAALNAGSRYPRPWLVAGLATLIAVQVFEATDGFGVMANTYDPFDFVANTAGVAVAILVDSLTSRVLLDREAEAPGSRAADGSADMERSATDSRSKRSVDRGHGRSGRRLRR